MIVHTILLLCCSASHSATSGESVAAQCSRPRSRAARAVLRRDFFPIVEAHGVQLSRRCPFHAASDMLLAHEAHKRKERASRWHCEYCGKVFRTEHYLDRHLNAHHNDQLAPDAAVCLADHCDVLGCDGDGGGDGDGDAAAPCDARAMQTARYFCQSAMHRCFSADAAAAASDDGAAHSLHESFNLHFCEALRCGGGGGGSSSGSDGGRGARSGVHLAHLRRASASSTWLRSAAIGALLLALLVGIAGVCVCRTRTLRKGSLLRPPRALGRKGKAQAFAAWLYQRKKTKAG